MRVFDAALFQIKAFGHGAAPGGDADGDADGSGGRSFAECDAIMGWSRDKARYLTNKCLQKLREADGAEALQEYLLTVA